MRDLTLMEHAFQTFNPRFFHDVLCPAIFDEYIRLAEEETLPNLHWTAYENAFTYTENLLLKNLCYRLAAEKGNYYPDSFGDFTDRHHEEVADAFELMSVAERVDYTQKFLYDLHDAFLLHNLAHAIAEPTLDPRASYTYHSAKGAGFSCSN